jgi:hypothetical protein
MVTVIAFTALVLAQVYFTYLKSTCQFFKMLHLFFLVLHLCASCGEYNKKGPARYFHGRFSQRLHPRAQRLRQYPHRCARDCPGRLDRRAAQNQKS